jgi:hypothetical protein
MKTLLAAATLILSASAAMAGAPCENPSAELCQKACAVMAAKFVLATHPQSHATGTPVRAAWVDNSDDNPGSLENAQRLAASAGLSLDYINGMTLTQSRAAVLAYCPK